MDETAPIDHAAIWDRSPDIGEMPAERTPGHTSITLNDIRTEADLRVERGRFGKLRTEIDKLRGERLSVGLRLSTPGHIDVFVSEHADSIKKVAAVGAVAGAAIATGVVIYMHEYHKRGK